MTMAQLPQDWPHRATSRFVTAGGLSWHVQQTGTGPTLLLIHGTAASTHSFHHLAELLNEHFKVIMVDLPGHGFSSALDRPTLPCVAKSLGALLDTLDESPVMIAGHSAGAAIAIRMILDGLISPAHLIGLAPALLPYGGAADGFASKLVKLAFLNPLAPRLISMQASTNKVSRLIAKTGSHLGPDDISFYVRLLRRSSHVAGALRLMAHWKLRTLLDELQKLETPTTFIVGENDMATSPDDVETAANRIRHCNVVQMEALGHLAHEEDPKVIADIIHQLAIDAELLNSNVTTDHRMAGGC